MQLNKLFKQNKDILLSFGALLIFGLALFGAAGFRFVLALELLVAPLYILLLRFKFGKAEALVFSVFLGIGILPTITYWSGLLLGSLVWGVVVAYGAVWGIAVVAGWRSA